MKKLSIAATIGKTALTLLLTVACTRTEADRQFPPAPKSR